MDAAFLESDESNLKRTPNLEIDKKRNLVKHTMRVETTIKMILCQKERRNYKDLSKTVPLK